MTVRLLVICRPLERLLSIPGADSLRNTIPGMQAVLAPPVSVDTVGLVAAKAAAGLLPTSGILTIKDINDAAK